MDISKQKSCLMCGIKKPINAFRNQNGKMSVICLQCLETGDDSEQGGGGGFQVNIVDKLAAIALEQEKMKTEAIENFEAITDRLDKQTEHSHNQDNQKKYNTGGLFNERRTGEMFRTTADNKTSQKQTAESTHNKSDVVSDKSKQDSQRESNANKTTTTHQPNTLFSNNTNNTSNTNQQTITVAQQNPAGLNNNENLSAADKMKAGVARGSSLFTTVPTAETLDKASGKATQAAQQTTDPKIKVDSKLDALATQFLENILRGPGRR